MAELLSATFTRSASTYTDAESGVTSVSVYCDTRPTGLAAKRTVLRDGLRKIASCGLDVGTGRISLRKLPHENWAESWKRHFKPLVIGDALLIKPSWSKRRSPRGQVVVVIDPGLSFGTGQHPTTEFCLGQLVSRRDPARQQAFLDIGTGSGILAIAAAKLGYAPVQAFDCDPRSVQIACANARANRVEGKVRITSADLTKFSHRAARQYDVICANLLANLLVAERDRVLARLKPAGVLVVAGILKREFTEVRRAYEAAGLRLATSKSENEWRSGTFVRFIQTA